MKFKKYKKDRTQKDNEVYVKLVTEDGVVKVALVDATGSIKSYLCAVEPKGITLFAYAYSEVISTEGGKAYPKIIKEFAE